MLFGLKTGSECQNVLFQRMIDSAGVLVRLNTFYFSIGVVFIFPIYLYAIRYVILFGSFFKYQQQCNIMARGFSGKKVDQQLCQPLVSCQHTILDKHLQTNAFNNTLFLQLKTFILFIHTFCKY